MRASADHRLLWQQRHRDTLVTQQSQDLKRTHTHTHAYTLRLSKLHLLIPLLFSFPPSHTHIALLQFVCFTDSHTNHVVFLTTRLSHSYTLITHRSYSAPQTKINSDRSQTRRPPGKSVTALFTWINSFERPHVGKLDYINNLPNLD